MSENLIYVAGHVQLSSQLLEQAQKDEAAWKRIERIARDPKNATPEELADLQRTMDAIAAIEDDR